MLVKTKILFFRTAYVFYRIYLSLFNLPLRGAVCLIECEGKVLLIRKTYGDKKWNLPGGGIGRRETPRAAAIRETEEEVGIHLTDITEIGSFTGTSYYKDDTIYSFHSDIKKPDFRVDGIEISEAHWFGWANLPDQLSDDVIIQMYKRA